MQGVIVENLGSFIAMDRRQAMAHGYSLPDIGHGSALFADVSGFTPLTEALVREYGPQRGAEEITANLNRVYDALIAQIHQYGGSVIGFSGDAITCWFDADDGARAVAAALAMQAALGRLANVRVSANELVTLSVKVAVTRGTVRRFRVGSPTHHFVDVMVGTTLDRLAQIEHHTERGHVMMDASSAQAIGDIATTRAVTFDGDAYAVVEALTREVAPQPWAALAPDALTDEEVRPWVIPAVYRRLRSGQEEYLAELRNVVAIFCRFEGIHYDDDPDSGSKLDAFVSRAQNVLARYEGELLQLTMGDKGSYLYGTFGAPVAHDDDTLRALAAAMDLRQLPGELDFIRNLQIGISAGRMRVGAYGSDAQRTYGAMGDETNLAARLMQYAAPGQIVVSQRVAQYAEHRYEFHPLGTIQVKGKTGDIQVLELRARRAAEVSVGGVSTPERRHSAMVGRDAERQRLRALLEHTAQTRTGGTLIIQGEAGIGKSRLVQDLLDQAAQVGVLELMGAGDAIEQSTLYFAWRPVFAHLFGLNALPEDVDTRRAHVLDWVKSQTDNAELLQHAPLLSAVLPFEIPDNDATIILGGRERAEATRELLARLLQRAAMRYPLMVVIEDAHWLDSASWALVQRVSTQAPSVLFILALRPLGEPVPPEFVAIQSAPATEHLELGPLPADDVTSLVQERLQVNAIPDSVAAFVRAKAEGNPFFSEELVYALRDAGILVIHDHTCTLASNAPALDELNFPDTVEGVVTSRIDRLSLSQQLAIKVASVIGRVFASHLLSQVYPVREDLAHLDADLNTIARLDLTPLEATEPELRYMFKHIITQEVSYSLLLYAQRQRLHRAVGEWYEKNFAHDLAPYYPLLVHHWTRTVEAPPFEPDAMQKAIDYCFKAGEQALRNDALLESITHFSKALELIKTLPESPQRDGMELGAQVLRAVPLTLTRGWANPDVGAAYERAHELTQKLGETPQMFLALVGVFTYYLVRGNFQQASEMADVNLAVAEKSGDPELILEASQDRGAAHFYMGQLQESVPHLARVGELYFPEKYHYHVFTYGRDPLAVALQHESLAYWYLGFPDKALERSDEAMRVTEQWHHPFSRAWVLISRCLTMHLRGDSQGMRAAAEEGIALAAAQGFPNWLAQGLVYLGWTMAEQGDLEQGIAKIREGLGIWRMTGAILATPYFMYLLADAHTRAGEYAEAIALVDEALAQIDRTAERVWEPELHRLRGELARRESAADAEIHFQRALAQARQQRARSNELRAATSLAQLWQTQGKAEDARALLQPIYASFTEGLTTRDLVRAKALLDTLNG
jgi:class 3 adenylate cyclase/predicted ATPase